MPQIRDPFIHEVDDDLRAAPANLLVSPKARQPPRAGRPAQAVMYIDVVSICNFTTGGGYVDIGFMVGSHITWSRTFTLGDPGHWTRNHVHYTLTSDYQVVARFHLEDAEKKNNVGDHVQMNINGYYMEPYTSP